MRAAFLGVLVAVLLLAGVATVLAPASGAPAAIPTPAAVTRPASSGFTVYTPFNGQTYTTTTTSSCVDVVRASVVDVVYVIDQTTTNTTTLTALWSIDGSTLVTGTAIASAVAVDTTDMQQLVVFGRYLCVRATTANTNSVVATVQVLAK